MFEKCDWTKIYLINIPKHNYQRKNTCAVTFFFICVFSACIHNICILIVTRLFKVDYISGIICPYLAKFMKHNKSNTTFLHEIVFFFSNLFVRGHLCD